MTLFSLIQKSNPKVYKRNFQEEFVRETNKNNAMIYDTGSQLSTWTLTLQICCIEEKKTGIIQCVK
ncbi:23448_t:CDS:2, partial [Dentiscutata erythropus]